VQSRLALAVLVPAEIEVVDPPPFLPRIRHVVGRRVDRGRLVRRRRAGPGHAAGDQGPGRRDGEASQALVLGEVERIAERRLCFTEADVTSVDDPDRSW
jgi:hypothetical protein